MDRGEFQCLFSQQYFLYSDRCGRDCPYRLAGGLCVLAASVSRKRCFLLYICFGNDDSPPGGGFVPLVVLMNKLGLANTRIGYILCMINVSLSVSILLLKTSFDKMPSALEDAARIDGCGRLQIWWNVALPLARPAIAVVVIINSLNVWNEFILANLLLSDDRLMPLQVGIMKFAGGVLVDYPVLMAGLTIAAVPIIIISLFMQKHINKAWRILQ